jgi:hypothetical protein
MRAALPLIALGAVFVAACASILAFPDVGKEVPADGGASDSGARDGGKADGANDGAVVPGSDAAEAGAADAGHESGADSGSDSGDGAASCDAGQTVCSGACVDLLMSNSDCGGCGLPCASSAGCMAGRCLVTLATGQGEASSLLVAGGNLFWNVSSSTLPPAAKIVHVPVSAPGPTTPVVDLGPVNAVYGFAVLGDRLYWDGPSDAGVTPDFLNVVNVGGGNPAVLSQSADYFGGLVADDAGVDWFAQDGGLFHLGPEDAAVPHPLRAPAPPLSFSSAAVAGGSLYLAATGPLDASPAGFPPDAGLIVSVPLDGGPANAVATGFTGPAGLVVNRTAAVWVSSPARNAAATVLSVPLAGGVPVTVPTGSTLVFNVVIDDVNIYWVDPSAGGFGLVLAMPLAGGARVTLAGGPSGPEVGGSSLAVDATSVYWTATDGVGTQSIFRLTPKPGYVP